MSNQGSLLSYPYLNDDLHAVGHIDYWLKKALEQKKIPDGSILQIQQIVNVSVPKQDSKQHYDPKNHVLKVTLTDGKTTCYGIIANMPEPLSVNVKTPPGTKIRVKEDLRVIGNWIVFSNKYSISNLGGNVSSLVDKWKFQQKLEEKQEWGATGHVEGSEGPPLWRPFGQKCINTDVAMLRKMKAMDIVNEKKESTDNDQSEFAAQRSEAISELMDKSVSKNWQKPKKSLIEKEIMDIMNEGFSMEEANEAMTRFKNPQKALRHLKAQTGQLKFEDRSAKIEERKDRRKKNMDPDEDDAPVPKEFQRPTKSISLFGFIAGHINEDDSEAIDEQESESQDRPDSHYSSFNDRGGRGGRRNFGSNRGGGFQRGRGRGGYQNDTERNERLDSSPQRGFGIRGYDRGSSVRGPVRGRGDHSSRGYGNISLSHQREFNPAENQYRGNGNYQNRGYPENWITPLISRSNQEEYNQTESQYHGNDMSQQNKSFFNNISRVSFKDKPTTKPTTKRADGLKDWDAPRFPKNPNQDQNAPLRTVYSYESGSFPAPPSHASGTKQNFQRFHGINTRDNRNYEFDPRGKEPQEVARETISKREDLTRSRVQF